MTRKADPVALAALLVVALLGYGGLRLLGGAEPAQDALERQAARTMAQALRITAQEAADRGCPPDPATDPNHTGLIGLPFSPLTTTLGSLPAKRTGAQPQAAALMVRLLREAGVRPGDSVAVDSSGSFPGFTIATLVAARTLDARATTLVSVGASTFGANRPEFTLADMLAVLARRGVLPRSIAAVSPGGASDRGTDMDPDALAAALARAQAEGAARLLPADLPGDVAARRALLGRPRVLVSVGGNWASAGPGEGVLGSTGLLRPGDFGPHGPAGTGLIQSCLRDGIPVLRILDVQDLCARTGLPFDPIPWPTAELTPRPHLPRWLPAVVPLLAFLAAWLAGRRASRLDSTHARRHAWRF